MESYRAKNGTVMFTKPAIPLQKPNRFMQETISTVHYTNKTVQRRDLLFMEDIPKKKQLRKPAVPCDRCLTSQKILA